jgi:hypothetical protein
LFSVLDNFPAVKYANCRQRWASFGAKVASINAISQNLVTATARPACSSGSATSWATAKAMRRYWCIAHACGWYWFITHVLMWTVLVYHP